MLEGTRDLRLEAFPVDDGRAAFIVFLFSDPHLLEGGQRTKNGTSNPDGIFSLRRCDDLDLHGGWGQSGEFFLHAVSKAGEHRVTTRQDDVAVQITTDVHIAFHDGVVCGLVNAGRFHSQEIRLEHGFRGTESLVSDGDDLTVGQFVRLFQGSGGGSCGHFLFKVQADVAEFLLDVTNDFTLGGGGERVSAFGQDLHQVIRQITASEIQTEDGVRQSVTFVDGHSVGDTIAGIEDDTGGTAGSVQRQDGLDGHIHGRYIEGLEHDLVTMPYG